MELTFTHAGSPVHRLDPRARVVVAVLLSLAMAASGRMPVLCIGLAGGVVLVALARLKLSRLLWHLATVNGFMLLLWVILPVSTRGAVVARWGPFSVTREGLLHALVITLRSNAILLKVCQNEQTQSWTKFWSLGLRVCDRLGTAVLSSGRE